MTAFAGWAIIVVLALAAIALPATAESRPFRLTGDQIFFTVRIGGRDANALLDTAARSSSISAAFAKANGIGHTKTSREIVGVAGNFSKSRQTRELSIDLGDGAPLRRPVMVLPEEVASSTQGADAVIGLDLLYERAVKLDFDRMTIEIAPSRSFVPPAGTGPAFGSWDWGQRTIPVRIGKVTGQFLVDTAASISLYLAPSFLAKLSPEVEASPAQVQVIGIDGSNTRSVVTLDQVSVADQSFARVPATIGGAYNEFDVDGIIGVDLLSRFNLTMDFGRRRMWMTPNASRQPPASSLTPP